ncbi:MAG: 4-alpha-glucanotransferase [Acidimicrobiales bacterium]|nr:4-alpha-glucanotransferase [Acidimicrobiales bacterium]
MTVSDIDETYIDASGDVRRCDPDTLAWLDQRLDRQTTGEDRTPVVLRSGQPWTLGPGTLVLEFGGELTIGDEPRGDIPLGYHTFVSDDPADDIDAHGNTERAIIVAPKRCTLPSHREWGWAVQLYALHSRDSWGIGDLGDLGTLARWSRLEQGAGFLLVNPLNASAPGAGQQPSPYSPTSRRFLNPVYADMRGLGVADADAGLVADLAARASALTADRVIDRDAVLACKMEALELAWRSSSDRVDHVENRSLRDFATWTALAERYGGDWRRWPAEYQHPLSSGVIEFRETHAQRVSFHAWIQTQLRRQLAGVCGETRLIQDLPIGFDRGGADAWCWQDLLALDASVGAPPDEFNTSGQDWGLPPFIPNRLRGAGYQPFIETVRACLAERGALRIDHVMGLFRLWWVPEGRGAAHGAYVRYPSDDLLAILALESHRARAVVIGEDLGTVEERAQAALAAHNVLSYKLLWFEDAHPSRWNPKAFAAVSTHDLPTVVGLWEGSDLASQRTLGLDPNEEGTEAIRTRLALEAELAADADAQTAVRATYRLLATTPAMLVAASLDDAVAEPQRPNIPGADGRRPNWSLRLPSDLETIQQSPLTADIAEALATA